MIDQLPLRVQLREETTFANFYGGNNITLLKALNELLEGKGESFIYLWVSQALGALIYYKHVVIR